MNPESSKASVGLSGGSLPIFEHGEPPAVLSQAGTLGLSTRVLIW